MPLSPEELDELLSQQQIAQPTSVEDYGRYLTDVAANPIAPPEDVAPPATATPREVAAKSEPQPAPAPQPTAPAAAPPPVDSPDLSSLVKQAIAARQGQPSDLDRMNRAYDTANKNQLIAGLGSAFNNIGYAIAGVKNPNPNAFDELHRNANAPVERAQMENKLRGEQALTDPNSPRSLVYRAMLQKLHPEYFGGKDALEGVSYADAPILDKLVTSKQTADARTQAAKFAQEQRERDRLSREDARDADRKLREVLGTARLSVHDQDIQTRNDNKVHLSTVNKIKGNKPLNDAVAKAQNLYNAVNNVEATGVITPQDMADMQSLAISNMGIGGASSAHERAERYAKTLGINAANAMQFLTGTPTSIGKDNPLFDRYKHIMQMEVGNFRDRVGKSFKALRSGNKSMYERRPDLSSDIDNMEDEYLAQIPDWGTQGGKQDTKISGYASQHGLSYDQAEKILRSRGYGK